DAGRRAREPYPGRSNMSEGTIGSIPPSGGIPADTRPVESLPGQVVRPIGKPQNHDAPAPAGRGEFDSLDLESLMLHAYAQFSVEPKTGIVSVKIVDSHTNEVIREIPSQALLHFAEEVESYLSARQWNGA